MTSASSSSFEDLKRIRRLLRNAFSDLVSLSDRVLSLEQKTQPIRSTQKRNVEIEGTLELNSGILVRRGEDVESSLLDGPLLQTKAKMELPIPGSDLELTGISSKKEFHLNKLLLKCAWLNDIVKLVFCPFGGNGSDVIPTLNPNAVFRVDEGISRMTRQGCPVHHELVNSSVFGGSVHHKGQMFGTGIFHSDRGMSRERLTCFGQGILSPSANFAFGLFASHTSERVNRHLVHGSTSRSVPPLPRFELWTTGREDSRSNGFRPMRWQLENLKFGAVSAWNLDDEFIISGWLAMKSQNQIFQTMELESLGMAISTFPYANIATQKLAVEISPHPKGGRKYSLECGAKHKLDNDIEVHPGYIIDFSKHGLSTWLGVKTLLKF